jgi:signal peptidase
MDARTLATYALELVAVLVVASVLVGQFYGTPVLLSFVETGSMEPTIDAGDGFVAIPAGVAGPVEEGDVVTFEAKELHGGGLTTHRVVGETEGGYITRGDGNPFTDQDGSEPPVTDGQITAKALQVGGEVVVIPAFGTAVMGLQAGVEALQLRLARLLGTDAVLGTQGISYLFFGFTALVYAAGLFGESNRTPGSRSRSRSRSRPNVYDGRRLVLAMILFVGVVSMGSMLSMSTAQQVDIVSASFDSERPTVIPAGETTAQNLTLYNGGLIPVVTTIEPSSNGVETGPPDHARLDRGETVNATVELTAPPETGAYVRSYTEYRYFLFLPESTILWLHAIHPWLAMASVTLVMCAVFAVPVVLLVGTGTVRTRERSRDSPGGWW